MKYLNLFYILALTIGVIILIRIGFIENDVTGYIIFITINLVGGILVLIAKKQNPRWITLVALLSIGVGFPIAVLLLKNKRGMLQINPNNKEKRENAQ